MGTAYMSTQLSFLNDYAAVVAPDKPAFLAELRDQLEAELNVVGQNRIDNLDATPGKRRRRRVA